MDLTSPQSIGEKLFKWRDYTPVPLVLLLLVVAKPSAFSATFGLLLILAGELFRIYSVAFIGAISRTRRSLGEELVTTGPFAWVRNPLYIGNFGIVMGLCLYSASVWLGLLTLALFAWQYYWIVQYEENILEGKFGETYRLYRDRVPAWLPKEFPRWDSLVWPESFGPALKSEQRTLSAIGLILVLLLVKSL